MRQVRTAEPLIQVAIVLIHVTAGIAEFIAGCGVVQKLGERVMGEE